MKERRHSSYNQREYESLYKEHAHDWFRANQFADNHSQQAQIIERETAIIDLASGTKVFDIIKIVAPLWLAWFGWMPSLTGGPLMKRGCHSEFTDPGFLLIDDTLVVLEHFEVLQRLR